MWRAAALVLVLVGCSAQERSETPRFPEPVVEQVKIPTGHLVGIGSALHDAGLSSQGVAQIADYAKSHPMPAQNVGFFVFKYPVKVWLPGRVYEVHSYRVPWTGPIVLGWWFDQEGRLVVGDIDWEVSHFVANTDDNGNPIPRPN